MKDERVAQAEEFAAFGAGDAGVGGEAVEVIEALGGGPCGELCAAQIGEAFLEAVIRDAGLRITRGNWAARAGIAAFEGDVPDAETHDSSFALGEKLILPERR